MTPEHKAIGVLAPQLSGDYFGTLLTGIHAVTRRHTPRLIAIQGSPEELARSRLAVDQVDGWIVINNADGIEHLAGSGVPLVTIGVQAPSSDHPALFPDNYAGMRAAVAHLIDHGHQRIAFIGNLDHHDIKQRYAGYQAALAERELVFDPDLVFPVADNSEQRGERAVQDLLAAGLSCTALAVATDENALGVLSALQAAGHRVPEDFAVVGFDDILLSHSATPPLTTIRLPIQALGSTAAELLLAQIAGHTVARGATYVTTALIPRRSCGCSSTIPTPSTGDMPGDHGWQAVLARQLAQLARYPVPLDPATPLRQIWPGGEVLIDAIAAAVQGTEEVSSAALNQAWQQAVALTQSLETILAILKLLEEAGARQLATLADSVTARERLEALVARLRLEMLRARLATETTAIRSYSSLIQQIYEISLALFSAEIGEAQQLAWLGQTPLSWACLGLWDNPAHPDFSALLVAGAYQGAERDGRLASLGNRYPPRSFPPDELLPLSVREAGTELVVLLPIKTMTHDWGVLALTGSIRYLHSSGNYNALNALATLLGAALERDALQQTLRAAYERERGLANIVRELGSPVIPLLPEVLLIPLVGAIDSARAQQIIETVLQGVSSHQATTVLLDISGVPLVDTQVANSLLQTARAATLLGARVILVGVRPEIAQSIVELGIELTYLVTQPTLAAALELLLNEQAQAQMGKKGG
jgi:DNA-binding LacI/PurR family transcriptional regulator/anti-anti-sigma regulatory factor